MKKLFPAVLFAALILGFGALSAQQCTINNLNTQTGFTPSPAPVVTQNAAYTQSVQVYVPTTITVSGVTATIDSVIITNITAMPTGFSYVINPPSGIIHGGGNGAICFSGTTSDTVGTYNLNFVGTATVTAFSQTQTLPLNQPPVSTAFNYAFTVQAGQQAPSCDTIFNMLATDTPEIWTFNDNQGDFGFLAGNNSYGDEAKAEEFTATAGNNVTGAYVFFSIATINLADSNTTIAVNVYDTTGTNGGPGNILATTNVTLASIAQQVTAVATYQQLVPLYVPFYSAPPVTTGNFFIGVVFPTNTGDTVAIFSNSQTTSSGRGWEQWSDGTWNNWDTVYTVGTPYHSGLYIAAITCPPARPVAAFVANGGACAGATIQYTDQSINGATSWNWTFTGGNISSSTTQNPTVTYANAGTFSTKLVATNTHGVDSTTQSVNIGANPTATATITPATSSTSATGSATIAATGGAGSYTFNWSNGSTTATITNVVAATYMVTITDANGCQYVDDTVIVTFVNGILQLSAGQQVKIYPNPATDVLNLDWSQKSNAEVSVIDLNGNVISTFVTTGDMKSVCNIRNLASGSYILRITDKTSSQQQSMLFSKF